MRSIVLILLILTASCASNSKRVFSIETDLAPYVQRFERLSGLTVEYNVEFAKLDDNLAGVCYSDNKVDGYRLIQVDTEYWIDLSDTQREQLVFHEIGHCTLGHGHRNSVNADSMPTSIMNSVAFNWTQDQYYRRHSSSYYSELLGTLSKAKTFRKANSLDNLNDFIIGD